MSAGLIVPGRALSAGGCEERAAGEMIDTAHRYDQYAAVHASTPHRWAICAGHAAGLRRAVGILLRIECHEVDQLYAARFGALVREVQGRPAGNATGRGGADPTPSTQLDLLEASP